ncbi:MAG TPA: DUF4956 domain-containing protein [bacterium]|nr:DUF4956 domain-containing protein [bacterium]
MSNINLSELLSNAQLLLNGTLSITQIVLSLLITLLMSLYIYYIYKKTYSGVLYSKNFNLTIVMTALIVNAIVIGISGNLVLSLGMVGALSIVRFRTAIKDPKDTAFLFWAITIGVINGVAYYELSLIATIFISLVLLLLSRHFTYEPSYVLILKHQPELYSEIEKTIRRYFTNFFIRSDSQSEQSTEKVIEIKINPAIREQVLNDIRQTQGVQSCVLLSSNGEFAE